MQKKGLSAVITTVLLILLSIIAVIIVWQIVKGSISDTAAKTGAINCAEIDLDLATTCTNSSGGSSAIGTPPYNSTVKVTLNRGTVSKLKVMLADASGTMSDPAAEELTGAELPAELAFVNVPMNGATAKPEKASIGAFILLDDGSEYSCGVVATKDVNC